MGMLSDRILAISLLSSGLVLLYLIGLLAWMILQNRRIRDQNEKYELVMGAKKLIWLDYHFTPQCLELSGALELLPGDILTKFMGVEVYEAYEFVEEKDSPIRSELRRFFDGNELYFKKDLHVKGAGGQYRWFSLQGTLIRNRKGKNQRFVAILENVDHQMSQERDLVEKAESDLLTGVLNKKTMEERVDVCLNMRQPNQYYVFFMVDMDNFKQVNDTLGHSYGDKVLTDLTDKLRKLFPHKALVGRLGGDEFAVCSCFEAFDEDSLDAYVKEKAQQINGKARCTYRDQNAQVDVSASVGIAVAPTDGMEFQHLYQKADKALYLSKRSGKNCYHCYEDDHALDSKQVV